MSHGKKSKRQKKKHPAGHKQPEGETKLNHKPDHINVSGKIEADFPPKLVEKYDAAGQKEESWNRKQFKVEVVTLFIIFIYTTVAAWQGCESQRTADIANQTRATMMDQFRVEQRPYLWLANLIRDSNGKIIPREEFVSAPAIGQRVSIAVTIENFGKSPARIVHAFNGVEIGKDAISKVGRRKWMDDLSGGIIPQGATLVMQPSSEQPIADKKMYDEGLASGGTVFFAVIQYEDTQGNLYETDICQAGVPINNTFNWVGCKEHYDIKDCKKDACLNQ